MKTTLYLIRHGESEGNKLRTFLGHSDRDLTPLGYEQAEKVGAYLRDFPIDVIYSSDLSRAYHTALPTARAKGLEVICSRNLREIFAGEWENRPFAELKTKFADDYDVWLRDIGNARCTNGEAVAELAARILSELVRIVGENEGKSIAIFTHATPIRALKTLFDDGALADMASTPWVSNASVTHLTCEDGNFSVLAYGVDFFQGDSLTKLNKNV